MKRGPGAPGFAFLALILLPGVAASMPGEMPWDHAGGPGRPDCTECHFDSEAVTQSPALRLEGLPEQVAAGAAYDLVLRLQTDRLKSAGFLMVAETRTARGQTASPGRFTPGGARTETGEGAIRSTAEGAQRTAPGVAEWHFSWRAPENFAGTVTMYVAAVAANDDLSPLGDGVHLLQASAMVVPKR